MKECPCDKLITWNEFAANAMRCWPRPQKRIGAPPVEARLLNGLNCLTIRRMPYPLRWIIAALCCRGGTRWAGLSHRSKAQRSGRGVEPDRFGQLCLTLIERPKFVGSQL